MPKAPPTHVLRRNQACRACRKKKLKCDAGRPHCGNCIKQWKGQISVPAPPGFQHADEPQCEYDPTEGLHIAKSAESADKIKMLEEQLESLKEQLRIATSSSPWSSAVTNKSPPQNDPLSSAAKLWINYGTQSLNSPESHTSTGGAPLPRAEHIISQNSVAMRKAVLNGTPNELNNGTIPHAFLDRDDSYTSQDKLLKTGWDCRLPDPIVMKQIVEAFFSCDPCASRILHKPSFLASMHYSPSDKRFPHSSILHAICASSSRWVLQPAITFGGRRREAFEDFHARITRDYVQETMSTGSHILDVLQACVILTWSFYAEAKWIEVWIFAGFQIRASVPLRLNFPGTFSTHCSTSPGAYLPPPRDNRDLELRRRTLWMAVALDRLASVGGWAHALPKQWIATEFPLRKVDFEADYPTESLPPNNPQDMSSVDLYITHLPDYTDSFILLLKAIMLYGEVTDFNYQLQLRLPATPAKTDDPLQYPEFIELDKLAAEDFLAHLPHEFKDCFGYQIEPLATLSIDTDLYALHLVPHAAVISLHNSYINFKDLNRLSTTRCYAASCAIIDALHHFHRITSDIQHCRPLTQLHPVVVVCWYLAAHVQVQLYKCLLEIRDVNKSKRVMQDIVMLRSAMHEFGTVSAIGNAQLKLLDAFILSTIKDEDKPHEAGSSLFLFSHEGVFGPQSASTSLPASQVPPQVSHSPNDLTYGVSDIFDF